MSFVMKLNCCISNGTSTGLVTSSQEMGKHIKMYNCLCALACFTNLPYVLSSIFKGRIWLKISNNIRFIVRIFLKLGYSSPPETASKP
jgi:hypothetical protein